MVRRLQLHGMWPPERPQVPTRPKASTTHSCRRYPHVLCNEPSSACCRCCLSHGHRSDGAS